MASKIDVYDIEQFLYLEMGSQAYSKSRFVIDLKNLSFSAEAYSKGDLLDKVSFDYYGTEELWPIVALYNDVIDPLSKDNVLLRIPSKSEVEKLLIDYVEMLRLNPRSSVIDTN